MSMIVCTSCKKFFHPKKNGVLVEEGMPHGIPDPLGKFSSPWSSYKLWFADLLVCNSCGNEVISGFAPNRWKEHYELDYDGVRKELVKSGKLKYFVEDCC